jgi:hypothetical protein
MTIDYTELKILYNEFKEPKFNEYNKDVQIAESEYYQIFMSKNAFNDLPSQRIKEEVVNLINDSVPIIEKCNDGFDIPQLIYENGYKGLFWDKYTAYIELPKKDFYLLFWEQAFREKSIAIIETKADIIHKHKDEHVNPYWVNMIKFIKENF